MKKVNLEIRDGFELVNVGDGKWEEREIASKIPNTWEEFCEMNPVKGRERYVNVFSDILALTNKSTKRDPFRDRNLLPNLKTAEAMRALCQLIQLRNFYNGDWEPDWTDVSGQKYVIINRRGKLNEACSITMSYVLAFRSEEICAQFLENFRDLIEIAKPLI